MSSVAPKKVLPLAIVAAVATGWVFGGLALTSSPAARDAPSTGSEDDPVAAPLPGDLGVSGAKPGLPQAPPGMASSLWRDTEEEVSSGVKSVTGVVLHEGGTPAAGAVVQGCFQAAGVRCLAVSGASPEDFADRKARAVADRLGRFSLRLPRTWVWQPSDFIVVEAQAQGYAPASVRLDGEQFRVNVVLRRASKVAGRVRFPDDVAPSASGVGPEFTLRLEATTPDGRRQSLAPDEWLADGTFSFDAAPSGQWTLCLLPIPDFGLPPTPWIEGIEIAGGTTCEDPRLRDADARETLRVVRLTLLDDAGFAVRGALEVRVGESWKAFQPRMSDSKSAATTFVTAAPVDIRVLIPTCIPQTLFEIRKGDYVVRGVRAGNVAFVPTAPPTPPCAGYRLRAEVRRTRDDSGRIVDSQAGVATVTPSFDGLRLSHLTPGEYVFRWTLVPSISMPDGVLDRRSLRVGSETRATIGMDATRTVPVAAPTLDDYALAFRRAVDDAVSLRREMRERFAAERNAHRSTNGGTATPATWTDGEMAAAAAELEAEAAQRISQLEAALAETAAPPRSDADERP